MSINATLSSIGDWNGQEKTAVNLWNEYIAPVLRDLIERQGAENPDEPPTVTATVGQNDGQNGRYAYAEDWAWEEFCSRLGELDDITSDDADEIAQDLALELQERAD